MPLSRISIFLCEAPRIVTVSGDIRYSVLHRIPRSAIWGVREFEGADARAREIRICVRAEPISGIYARLIVGSKLYRYIYRFGVLLFASDVSARFLLY